MAKKQFSIDIQVTEEHNYQVEAEDEDEACDIAMRKFTADEDADHTEIVGDATITNFEEI